jgi:hypothetical protein
MTQRQIHQHWWSSRKQQAGRADKTNDVSRKDASKEVATPTGVVVARLEAGSDFHPETMQQGCHSTIVPSAGEQRPKAPPPFHQRESGEGFRPERRTPLRPFATASRHHHCSHSNQGDVHVDAPHSQPSWLRLAVIVPTPWRLARPTTSPAAAILPP